ncbi:PaaI family thioesterase, partial [Deltaproteobacteria bacterium OttesenSCG-928-K17]|nr:PaaI family thioesterase [Deltaproteobacteria bacterium OttesenSCG-928-K17]
MTDLSLERLPGSPGCFICDNNNSNPRSLRLKLMWDDAAQKVRLDINPDATWCGYDNVVHGGLVASVMDEAMAWAIKRQSGHWAFTADFQVRYKKPVEPGRSYTVTAG